MSEQEAIVGEIITSEDYDDSPAQLLAEDEARLQAYHDTMLEMQTDLPPRGIPRIGGLSRQKVMQAFHR